MKRQLSTIIFALLFTVTALWAANPPASLTMIPAQINYQGRLMTTSNTPYADTSHTIDLTLYATAAGGTPLWSEQYIVRTRDGYFSVDLGSGGTELLTTPFTNRPIWQVLWKADNTPPDTFFMSLAVRTDPNGVEIPNRVETSPRQQFLTAPFAYRAHQSVYSRKADDLFDAPLGVQTPTLSGTNLALTALTNLIISGKNVELDTAKLTMKGLSPFVWDQVSQTANTNGTTTFISHTIDTLQYSVVVVGWSTTVTSTQVRGVSMYQNANTVNFEFRTNPTAGTCSAWLLGIRTGLIKIQ